MNSADFHDFKPSYLNPAELAETLLDRWAAVDLGRVARIRTTDKWLLSSALQKLIRRGHADTAVAVALRLHDVDPAYLQRRLPVIAAEDVGVADMPACFDVVTLCTSARWWRTDPRRTIQYAVTALAQAAKSRAMCDAACLGDGMAALFARHAPPFSASRAELIDVAIDSSASLIARVNALRVLGGIQVRDGRYYKTLSRCDLAALDAVAELLDVPPLARWLMSKQPRTAGLAALLPIAVEAATQATQPGRPGRLQSIAQVGAIPLCAVDQFSAIGKGVLAKFFRANEALRDFAAERVAPRASAATFTMALFHVESSILDRRLASPLLDELTEETEVIELRRCGLLRGSDGHQLYEVLQGQMPLLNDMRKSALEESAVGAVGVL